MKRLRAWLRMVPSGGAYPLPDSEAAYLAHTDLIDVCIPAHGGRLQADGSWLQQAERIDNPWAQALPGLAADAGQRYVPAVDMPPAQLLPVLADEALQEAAADNLVALALERFDAPWGAVMADVADVPAEWRDAYGDFLLLLSARVRQAGIPFEMAYYGVKWDNPAYFDPRVAAQAADHYDCYCYASGTTNWDHAATVQGIEYALACGIPDERMALGWATYSCYWPVTGETTRYDITHAQALEVVYEKRGCIQWVEYDEKLIRNKYANVRRGHLWLSDGDVLRSRLEIVDRYGLDVMLFTPGLEDDLTWQVIDEWKS